MPFNFWEPKEGDEIVAIFKGQYKSVGAFKKNVYFFRDGKKSIHIWGLVQINNLFYGVPFGTKVALKYLGMEKMPDSKRMFKNFELKIIAPPDDEPEENDEESTPE